MPFDCIDSYPIVHSFQDWQFPHGHIPDSWPQTTPVTTPPSRCSITNSSLAVEDAHLVPKTEALWYTRNGMEMYGEDLRDVKNAINTVYLRSDLHKYFDDRYLVIVPKIDEAESSSTPIPPQYATHILSTNGAELWPRRHNVLVQYIPPNSRPYLFGRFAWAILLQVKIFLLQGVSRHIIRVGANEDGKVRRNVELLTGYHLRNLYGGGGSKAATPIRKRVGGDGASDDDDAMESSAYDSRDAEDGKVRNKRRRQDSDESQDDQQYALIGLESFLRETLSGGTTTSGI